MEEAKRRREGFEGGYRQDRTQGTAPLCFASFAQRGQSPCATEGAVVDFLGFGEVSGRTGDVVGGSGRELFHERDQLQTEFVAENIGLQIGGVGDIGLTDGIEVSKDLLPADTKQRTDDVAISGTDARETMNACASQKIHEQGLHRIVAVMSHTDRLSTDIIA